MRNDAPTIRQDLFRGERDSQMKYAHILPLCEWTFSCRFAKIIEQNRQAMIRFILKIGMMLVAGILIYNFFFGTNEEKEQSRKIFGQLKDVVVSVSHLVKSEKQKYDAGKYDTALEKLGGAYQAVRKQAQHLDANLLKRLDELEQRKASLKAELDSIEQGERELSAAPAPKKGIRADPKAEKAKADKEADQQRRKEALQRELEQLFKDSETLLQQAQERK